MPILGLLFLGAAIVVCVASSALSTSATRLADHLHLGQALAGQLLLATVEDLPEVVIVVAGAASGHLALITGNLLGGIAAQTVLLAAIDATGVRDRPLSYRATSLQLVLVGLQGVLIFGLVIMAAQLPASLHLWRLDPGSIAILLAWLGTTWLLKRAQSGLPWQQEARAPLPPDVARASRSADAEDRSASLRRTIAIFGIAALAILGAGYALEETSSRLAEAWGLGGLVFGATVLALVTGLPEFVTGYTASRRGDFARLDRGACHLRDRHRRADPPRGLALRRCRDRLKRKRHIDASTE
jgi:cation:H+ antiporter